MIRVSKLFAEFVSNTLCCLINELEANFGQKQSAVHIACSLEAHKPFVYVYIVVFSPNYYFRLIKKCKLSSSLHFGCLAQSRFFFFYEVCMAEGPIGVRYEMERKGGER